MLTLEYGTHQKTRCLCRRENGRTYISNDCPRHSPIVYELSRSVAFIPPVIIDGRKKRILQIRNSTNYFCEHCIFDERGVQLYLSFRCTVHAPQTGKI